MSDPLDISDMVEDLPDAKVFGGFVRVCNELGIEQEDFDLEDPEHYEAFSLELRTMAVSRFTEGFVHDLLEEGTISAEDVYVNEEGELRLSDRVVKEIASASAG